MQMQPRVAACLLVSLAASLAGCGREDPDACPAVTGPIVTIPFAMDLPIDVFTFYNDFNAEISSLSGSVNSVSIVVAESLVEYLNVSQDASGHAWIGFVDTDRQCSTGASAKIMVPNGQFLTMIRSYSSGSVKADYVSQGLKHYGGAGNLTAAIFGEDVEIHANSGSAVIATTLACTSATIAAEGVVSVDNTICDRVNITTSAGQSEAFGRVTVIGGSAANDVSVTMEGDAEVDLGDLSTQSAQIQFLGSATGSLTGMTSQSCSIEFLPSATGSVKTTVTSTAEATCDGNPPAMPGSLVIQGGAIQWGSCFAGAAGVQALV